MGTHGRWGSGASIARNAADSPLVNDAALDDGRHGVMLLNFFGGVWRVVVAESTLARSTAGHWVSTGLEVG